MAFTVIIHLANEDPLVAEMEELPNPGDTNFRCINPRRKDGKPVLYVDQGCTSLIFSWNRVSFMEVMGSEEEEKKVVEFFRE